MTAYCGMGWDDVTGTAWLPLGGGHSDYGGNESYKIPLNVDAPSFSMFHPPSGSTTLIAGGLPAGSTAQASSYILDDGQELTNRYADGRPRATHSYRKAVHVPGKGIVLPYHGGGFTSAATGPGESIEMNMTTGEWTFHAIGSQAPYFNQGPGCAAAYDSLRGQVLALGAGSSQRLYRVDPTTFSWSQVMTAGIMATGDTAIIYLADYDVVFNVCAYYANGFAIIDASTGAVTYPGVTGTPPASMDAAFGFDWVPGVGVVFCIGKTLYALTPTGNPRSAAWAWSVYAADNASLPTDTGSKSSGGLGGMYSKFGYSKKLGGLYRFTDATHKPWFYATERP